jgi:hypothetical protein
VGPYPRGALAFAVATATGGALVIAEATTTGRAPGGILVPLVCALVVALAWKRARYGLSFGFVALAGLAVIQAAYSFPSLHAVLYRASGTDWLTYESLLATSSRRTPRRAGKTSSITSRVIATSS